MPFWLAVVWFFTSTRSPATTETPSMVCAPDRVMFAVVAAWGVFGLIVAVRFFRWEPRR